MNTKHATALFAGILLVALAGAAAQTVHAQLAVGSQRIAQETNASGGPLLRA
jgi:hypothetical protein